jgi:NitT/TauT family transport system substrate-binding protein
MNSKNVIKIATHKATIIALLLLTLTVFVLSPGCQPKSTIGPTNTNSTTSTTPIKLSVNSWVGWGPLFIAKEKGFFDGLNVDINFIEDAGVRRTAMISGQVDGYASSVDNLAIDATYGVTGKTVLCFDESAGADGIVAKSNINWDNIKGRKVAVQKGLPGHFLLLYVLSQHGLKPSDVQIIDLDADKAGSGFVSGTLDVAVTWEPWISKAAAMSGGKKLITTAELPGLIVDTFVVRDPVLQSRPDDIRRLIKGWFNALDYYKANPDDGNRIIAAAYKLKPEEVKDIVSGIKFYDLSRNREFMGNPTNPGPIYKVFNQASSLWKDAGVVTNTVDANRYIDLSYLP